MNEKICGKCKKSKDIEMFYKDRRRSDGLQFRCKDCEKKYKYENREKIKKWQREHARKNRQKNRERNRKYHAENRERINEQAREYHRNNSEKLKQKSKEYYEKNKEKIAAYQKLYKVKEKDRLNRYGRSYRKRRMKEDPKFALIMRISKRMNKALERAGYSKSRRSIDALGCSAEEFRSHIERQFLKGMNWKNRDEWHLDHIVPVSSAKDEDEVYALSHFTNIRPMWAKDNISKRDKITHLI